MSSTALGDWYANLVRIGARQLVLCTSEQGLLPVVLGARDVRSELGTSLRKTLRRLLGQIGVTADQVEAELQEMGEYKIGRTASRVVLGSMNDFTVGVDAALHMHPTMSLEQLSLELADTPCGPLAYSHPAEQAKSLLEGAWRHRTRR